MFSKSILAAAALLGISAVEAHMIMTEPIPYGKDTLNNSPLAADGSDFPCKLRSNTYEVTEWNTAQIGESMPLTFEGSATHGGGSCQVSLTTDLQPTKDSEWMVIKSIEGGCPANVDGNLSGGASMADPTKFNYTIPDGISPGKYTLAWTWFNRIGNREMYMNCAPLEVQSASSKRSEVEEKRDVEKRSSTFPPMFVANVNGCTTSEGVDIRFPQPGDDIQYNGEPSNLASAGAAACTGTPTFAAAGDSSTGSYSGSGSSSGSGSGSASSSAAAVVTSAPAANTYTAPAVANTPAPSSGSSGSSSGSGSGSGSNSVSSPQPSSSSSASSSSSSGALSGSCSVEGEWNCINGSSFQRCANGQWTPAQNVAAGTQCTAGQSSNLAISAIKLKPRTVREGRARRHAHGGHVHA